MDSSSIGARSRLAKTGLQHWPAGALGCTWRYNASLQRHRQGPVEGMTSSTNRKYITYLETADVSWQTGDDDDKRLLQILAHFLAPVVRRDALFCRLSEDKRLESKLYVQIKAGASIRRYTVTTNQWLHWSMARFLRDSWASSWHE